MLHTKRRNQGIALITAIAFLVITVALVGTALVVTTINIRLSRSNSQTIQTQLAAESGIDAAVARVWHSAVAQILKDKQAAGDTLRITVEDYRNIWDKKPDTIGLSQALETGQLDPNDATVDGFGAPVQLSGKVNVAGSDVFYDINIERFDVTGGESHIRITSTGMIKDSQGNVVAQRRLSQTLSVRLPPFELEFALLSDFINCAFCHSAFISIEAAYHSTLRVNTPIPGNFRHLFNLVPLTDEDVWEPAIADTRRIRVAGLRNMNISNRIRNVNTLVGGTMYTRGYFNVAQGDEPTQNIMHTKDCTTVEPYKATSAKCGVYLPFYREADGVTTDVIANEDWKEIGPVDGGNTESADLLSCTPQDGDSNAGCDQKRARFYESYPRSNESTPAIDGSIPDVEAFPSPIADKPDASGVRDRIISNDEWQQAVRDSSGRIGRLTGGAQLWLSSTNASGIPDDTGISTFSINIPINVRNMNTNNLSVTTNNISTANPVAAFQTVTLNMHQGLDAVNSQKDGLRGYKGNMILIGTATNPISFTGSLYVDGDVIIAGYIAPGKSGVILARRNVYVVGDVLYDCNGTAPGGGCNYTDPESLPAFALVAAGSIIVGDPTATRHANNFMVDTNNGLVNRAVSTGTGTGGTRWGTYALQGELTAFNHFQHSKRQSEIPRYYVMREGDTLAWRCQVNLVEECTDYTETITGTKYNLSAAVNPPRAGQITFNGRANPAQLARGGVTSIDLSANDVLSTLEPQPAITPSAVVMSLSPSHHWLTPLEGLIDTNGNGLFNDADGAGYNPLAPGSGTSLQNVGDAGSRNSRAVLGFVPDRTGVINNNATRYWDDVLDVRIVNGASVRVYDVPSRHKQRSEIRAIISESVITALWNQYGNNTSTGRTIANPLPLQFDGLLYTNNALLNYQPHRGPTGGGWIVNGSIISFETGILAYGLLNNALLPANAHCFPHVVGGGIGSRGNLFTSKRDWRCVGLRVHYDKRLPRLIDIGVGEPVLTRLSSEYVPIP